jgi:hypothetical protein
MDASGGELAAVWSWVRGESGVMRAYTQTRGLLGLGMTMLLASAGCGGNMQGICADCDGGAPQLSASDGDGSTAESSDMGEGSNGNAEPSELAPESTDDAGTLPDTEAEAGEGSTPETPSSAEVPAAGPVADAPSGPGETSAPASSAGGPAPTAPACGFPGSYAMQVAFKLRWSEREFASVVPSVRAGQGESRILLLAKIEAAGEGVRMDVHPCQATLPDLRSNLTDDRYGFYFADAVWDSLSMPSFSMAAGACSAPGCAFIQPFSQGLVGAALPTASAPWPATAAAGTWPDHDGDRLPGITAEIRGPDAGPKYAYLPIDALGGAVAHTLGLGVRIGYGFRATRPDCNSVAGEVTQGALDWRAVSCLSTTSSVDCNQDLWFINENLPQFSVTSGTVAASRLPEPADCRAVRAAFGPR